MDERSVSNNYLSELSDDEVTAVVDNFIAEHSSAVIFQLLTECEFVLNESDATIASLNARGLRHIANILSGKEKRNKEKLRVNIQTLQRLQIRLHRAILNRIETSDDVLRSLIDRENKRDRFMLEGLQELADKIIGIKATADMSLWLSTLRDRTFDQRKYEDLPLSVKAYRIVADYCELCPDRKKESPDNRKFTVDTALRNLDISNETIWVSDYYKQVLDNPSNIYLFELDECVTASEIREKMSYYGQLIYGYPMFMRTMIEERKTESDISFKDAFIEYVNQQIEQDEQKLPVSEFCCNMVGDVLMASDEIIRITAEQRKREKEDRMQKEKEERERIEAELRLQEERNNAYVLKITPEGIWKLGVKEIQLLAKGNPGGKYIVSEDLKSFMALNAGEWKPVKLILGIKVEESIGSLRQMGAQIVQLTDYYMRLWFDTNKSAIRAGAKVVFLDYYDHKLYVKGYQVDPNGESYNDLFPYAEIKYNRTRGNIKKDICEKADAEWDEILVYRVFDSEKWIAHKSNKININHVDSRWENFLTESVDSFWKIIGNLE